MMPELTASTFKFNEFDVCTNPETIEVYESKSAKLTIFLAQDESGKWRAGYNGMFSNPYYGTCVAPAKSENRKAFETREEAIKSVADRFLNMKRAPSKMKEELQKLVGEEPKLGGLFA